MKPLSCSVTGHEWPAALSVKDARGWPTGLDAHR